MTSLSRRVTTTTFAVLLATGIGLASAATIKVRLTGSHEVPAVHTNARGAGMIDIAKDGAVSGEIHTRGIKGTMAHIHDGAPGTNGPILIPLVAGPHGTWVVPPGSKLTAAQYRQFLAGDLYVNVHSAKHPGGEIRAQLKPH